MLGSFWNAVMALPTLKRAFEAQGTRSKVGRPRARRSTLLGAFFRFSTYSADSSASASTSSASTSASSSSDSVLSFTSDMVSSPLSETTAYAATRLIFFVALAAFLAAGFTGFLGSTTGSAF